MKKVIIRKKDIFLDDSPLPLKTKKGKTKVGEDMVCLINNLGKKKK